MVALSVILFPPLLIAFLLCMERVEEPLRRRVVPGGRRTSSTPRRPARSTPWRPRASAAPSPGGGRRRRGRANTTDRPRRCV